MTDRHRDNGQKTPGWWTDTGMMDRQTLGWWTDRHRHGGQTAGQHSSGCTIPFTTGSAPSSHLQIPQRTLGMWHPEWGTNERCHQPWGTHGLRVVPPQPSPLRRLCRTILILLLLHQRLSDGLQLAQAGATLQVLGSWEHRGAQRAEPQPPVSPHVPVPAYPGAASCGGWTHGRGRSPGGGGDAGHGRHRTSPRSGSSAAPGPTLTCGACWWQEGGVGCPPAWCCHQPLCHRPHHSPQAWATMSGPGDTGEFQTLSAGVTLHVASPCAGSVGAAIPRGKGTPKLAAHPQG